MSDYRHIVFAVDPAEGALQVGKRAAALARMNQARMTLVHVVETTGLAAEVMPPVAPLGGVPPITLGETEQQALDQAEQALRQVAEQLGLSDSDQRVVVAGSTKRGIFDVVEELAADLIVVGSHGRHGLALLLGSTANSILHGAPCDVLAVRLKS